MTPSTAAPAPPYDLDAVRREVPVLRDLIPMNACSQAPQGRRVRAAAEAYLDSWSTRGMDWDAWMAEVEAARAAFAATIGADADDVAVATSVSQATASVATGLDWSEGRDRVVVGPSEFPAVAHVWKAAERSGARVAWVGEAEEGAGADAGRWADLVDGRTLVVSAAHADYRTGAKQDLEELAALVRDRGALLYVDAYQVLGTEPFHAPSSGADFVAAGMLKYLMGMPGIAFLWVRPGLAERLRPTVTGWFGRAEPFAFDPRRLDWGAGARRLDVGTPPVLEAYVARAALEWLAEIGLEAVGAWTRALGDRLVGEGRARGLEPRLPTAPGGGKAQATAFPCADAHAVERRLRDRGILASARGDAVRLAPHFYSSFDDVDRALDALEAEIR